MKKGFLLVAAMFMLMFVCFSIGGYLMTEEPVLAMPSYEDWQRLETAGYYNRHHNVIVQFDESDDARLRRVADCMVGDESTQIVTIPVTNATMAPEFLQPRKLTNMTYQFAEGPMVIRLDYSGMHSEPFAYEEYDDLGAGGRVIVIPASAIH